MLQRVIFSTLQEIDRLCAEVLDKLQEYQVADELFGIMLMLREALTNAVNHGCKGDPTLSVECLIKLNPSEIVIVVRDPGEGFNWKEQHENLARPESESGRGLNILARYASKIDWNESGNELTITRALRVCDD